MYTDLHATRGVGPYVQHTAEISETQSIVATARATAHGTTRANLCGSYVAKAKRKDLCGSRLMWQFVHWVDRTDHARALVCIRSLFRRLRARHYMYVET